jgi:hypothetical protein
MIPALQTVVVVAFPGPTVVPDGPIELVVVEPMVVVVVVLVEHRLVETIRPFPCYNNKKGNS